jgi:hypothetical protein
MKIRLERSRAGYPVVLFVYLFSFSIDRTAASIHILFVRSGGIFFKQTGLFLSKIFQNLHDLHENISADEVKPTILYHGNSADEDNQAIKILRKQKY